MPNIDEGLIKITEYNVKGSLPNPFVFDNGEGVRTVSDWERRRKEIYKTAIELQYGTMPPKPELLEVETLYFSAFGGSHSYKIATGRRSHPVSFVMRVIPPKCDGKFPVVIDGDLCFDYAFDREFINTFLDEGIGLVLFNRTELAHDVNGEGRARGQLYEAYPEYTFGALGAWAWGYSRCVDALEKLGFADMSCIVFTGHSRGGKTAALAGALDERAAIVNPNETCAGACGCYRIEMKAITEDGDEIPSETLEKLWGQFDFWMGPRLGDYVGKEDELPFDSHFLKAMIAPRVLFVSEAASDIWANPVGSYMTTSAAGEVYKFLDCPENLLWYYRHGYHNHSVEDVKMLVNIIKHKTENRPLSEKLFRLPFKAPELIYDWRCPKKP